MIHAGPKIFFFQMIKHHVRANPSDGLLETIRATWTYTDDDGSIREIKIRGPFNYVETCFVSYIYCGIIDDGGEVVLYKVDDVEQIAALIKNLIYSKGAKNIEPSYSTTYVIDLTRKVLIVDDMSFVALSDMIVVRVRAAVRSSENYTEALKICLIHAYQSKTFFFRVFKGPNAINHPCIKNTIGSVGKRLLTLSDDKVILASDRRIEMLFLYKKVVSHIGGLFLMQWKPARFIFGKIIGHVKLRLGL